MKISQQTLSTFEEHLRMEEKSSATLEKYLRDARSFCAYLGERSVTKELVVSWKRSLVERGYAIRSVNSMVAAVNRLLRFLGLEACRVKHIRTQRQIYSAEERELTKSDYVRLLAAAGKKQQLRLAIQTICATGIRVSELRYFTVEAVRAGTVCVDCKNKTRTILIPGKLKNMLMNYARSKKIESGPIFVSRNGKPLNRSSIWASMKKLCAAAGVAPAKVFPHNLRKLFARTFYGLEKDIAKLADLLGHSSINTTRIYIMTTGTEHRRQIERMGLIVQGEG